jgi:uncharacterized protein YjeT (DUF2065 family)
MKVILLAIGLTLCLSGLSFAQAPGGHKATARTLPRPSPSELRRCSLSHKILNAVARSACTGHARQHG